MKKEKTIRFECTIRKETYYSDDYKIYTAEVDTTKYKDMKETICIVGNMPILLIGGVYSISAEKVVNKKYGLQYQVEHTIPKKPTNIDMARAFLNAIITKKQTDALLNVYPDIIDLVINDELYKIKVDLLKGIGQPTLEKIIDKINMNFKLVEITELFDNAISLSTIQRIGQKYNNNVRFIKEKLSKDPYRCLCRISRLGFKTADKILLGIANSENPKIIFKEPLLTSKQRMLACVEFILSENEGSGNTRINIKEVREKCGKLTPECLNHFVTVIKEATDVIHIDYENKLLATKKSYDLEVYISDTIKAMLKNDIKWNIDIEKYRKNGEYPLTDEQMRTLSNICNHNVSILTAPGGAGKSFSIASLINMLKDNDKKFILMTPTGKSSEVLAEYTGEPCGTIHRQLEYNPKMKEQMWGFCKGNKLKTDVVVIDEFSMMDIELMGHLLDAIDVERTKLLLVFDPYQLASVSCGNISSDFLASKIIPTTQLTKIFRYGEGGLMKVATCIRNGEKFCERPTVRNLVLGTKKDFIYTETFPANTKGQIIKIYDKLLKSGYTFEDIVIGVAQNKGDYGTIEINKFIQYCINKDKNGKYLLYKGKKFYEGDKVIQTRNDYKAIDVNGNEVGIFNGNTGVVSRIGYNEIDVKFKDKTITYAQDGLSGIELGYCCTIHKLQGSQAKQVIVVAPSSHAFMLNSNLLYVAVTRAKERVFMLGNLPTINRAIKKKENLMRDTNLIDLLQKK